MAEKTLQYTQPTRIAVHKRCVQGIEQAQEYIREITESATKNYGGHLTAQDERDIKHLQRRIKEFKLSILIVYNTERIREMRANLVDGWTAQVAVTDPNAGALSTIQKKLREQQIKVIARAQKCKNPHCNGRGWIGIKEKAGEFELCACTIKTIDFYVTVDEPTGPAPVDPSETPNQQVP